MTGKEIEFKYIANVTLEKFIEYCNTLKPLNSKFIAGYDYFYSNPNNRDEFFRLRHGADNDLQLTYKKKIQKDNSYRIEHNVDLKQNQDKSKITALLKDIGYNYNFTLFKNCFIFDFTNYTMVYYICYDENMELLGKFIEIEMSEEHEWQSKEEAMKSLVLIEKFNKALNISKGNRVLDSLYEMFRKEITL